jgi:hypothetical protein
MLLYALGQKYLVDATAEVAGDEKIWHSINRLILSDLMLLYALGQKYLVDATAEVADLIPEVERIILETRRKPIFGEDITQHVKNHKVQVSEGQVQSRLKGTVA